MATECFARLVADSRDPDRTHLLFSTESCDVPILTAHERLDGVIVGMRSQGWAVESDTADDDVRVVIMRRDIPTML